MASTYFARSTGLAFLYFLTPQYLNWFDAGLLILSSAVINIHKSLQQYIHSVPNKITIFFLCQSFGSILQRFIALSHWVSVPIGSSSLTFVKLPLAFHFFLNIMDPSIGQQSFLHKYHSFNFISYWSCCSPYLRHFRLQLVMWKVFGLLKYIFDDHTLSKVGASFIVCKSSLRLPVKWMYTMMAILLRIGRPSRQLVYFRG